MTVMLNLMNSNTVAKSFGFKKYSETTIPSTVTVGQSITFPNTMKPSPFFVFFTLGGTSYSAYGIMISGQKFVYNYSSTVSFEFDFTGSAPALSMYTSGSQTDMSSATNLKIYANTGLTKLYTAN